MAAEIPYGERTKEFNASPSEVRDRLREEISFSDIDFDEDNWCGLATILIFELTYRWTITEIEDGTEVTEQWWINKFSYFGYLALLLPVLGLTAWVLNGGTIGSEFIGYFEFGYLLLGSFIPGVVTVVLVDMFPMPIENMTTDVRNKKLSTITIPLVFVYISMLVLLAAISFGHIYGYLMIQSTIGTIVFAVVLVISLITISVWVWALTTNSVDRIAWGI
jgi:hypothetical protein